MSFAEMQSKEPPTAAMVVARFPLFSNVDSTLIEFAIERAVLDNDPRQWPSRAYRIAIIYLALHYLYVSGEPKRSDDLLKAVEADYTANKDVVTGVNSLTVGPLTVGLKTDSNSVSTSGSPAADKVNGDAEEYERSSYGRQYLLLRRKYLGQARIL